MTNASDPRTIIDHSPMSWLQVRGIAVIFSLNALDGFDLLSITFAAPNIARLWSLDAHAVGLLISAGLAGMAIGSLLFAPMADRVGRRPVALVFLSFIAIGMLLASAASSWTALLALRLFTGLGIGAIIPSITSLTAEYSNARRRHLAVTFIAIGFPIGALVGGAVAAWLLIHYEWRSIFLFGGVMTALSVPVVWRSMPESIGFLLTRRPPGALERVNRALAMMGHAPVPVLPEAVAQRAVWFDVVKSNLLARTLVLLATYFLHSATYYYAITWIPSVVAELGYSASQATQVSVWANMGGAIGGMVVGLLASHFPIRTVMAVMLACSAVLVAVFGGAPGELTLLKLAAAVMGLFLTGSVIGFYALMTASFPTAVRASGIGLVIGIGRFGSVLGPAAAGVLFSVGLDRWQTALIMATGSLAAAAILAARPLGRANDYGH